MVRRVQDVPGPAPLGREESVAMRQLAVAVLDRIIVLLRAFGHRVS